MTESLHTPDVLVEKLAAGQLSESEAEAVRKRLEAEGGLGRLDDIARSNEAILSEYPARQMAATICERYEVSRRARSLRRNIVWYLAPASALAAAAAFFFMMSPASDTTVSSTGEGSGAPFSQWKDDTVRVKGAPQLHIHRQTRDGNVRMESGARAAAGDVLQIKFNTADARRLVICSVDGRGAVTLHYPKSPTASTTVSPRSKKALPFGYELDDAPRFERFFMVWSEGDAPLSAETVMAQVKELKNAEHDPLPLNSGLHYKDMTVKK